MGGALLEYWKRGSESFTIVDPFLEKAPEGVTLVKERSELGDKRFDVIIDKTLRLALDSLKQAKLDKELELTNAKRQAAHAQEELEATLLEAEKRRDGEMQRFWGGASPENGENDAAAWLRSGDAAKALGALPEEAPAPAPARRKSPAKAAPARRGAARFFVFR